MDEHMKECFECMNKEKDNGKEKCELCHGTKQIPEKFINNE